MGSWKKIEILVFSLSPREKNLRQISLSREFDGTRLRSSESDRGRYRPAGTREWRGKGGGEGEGIEPIRWKNPYDESSFEASLGIWDLTVDSCYIQRA